MFIGKIRQTKHIFIRFTLSVLMIITAFCLGACSAAGSHPEFLTDHSWLHYAACDEHITFDEDGHYSYYCSCGEPVGNSDIYDEYSYNEDDSTITLKPSGDDNTIKVLRVEKSRLLLDFDGQVKEFIDSDDKMVSEAYPECVGCDTEGITENFSSYLAILEKHGDDVVTAPAAYDGDNPDYDEYILSEKMSDNALCYEWQLDITESADGTEYKITSGN